MMDGSTRDQKLNQLVEAPSSINISQCEKPVFINHIEVQQSKPLNIWFCIITALLKILPILLFFVASGSKVLGFTLVLISACVDFWTTKNISGRQLVGMIWWMEVRVNGNQQWIFHSNRGYSIDKTNESIFWGSLLLGCAFWGVSALLCLIVSSLFWITLCLNCFILTAMNFYCFMKCEGNHRAKLRQCAAKIGIGQEYQIDYE